MAAVTQTAEYRADGMQLLLPPAYDVLWSVLALGHVALLAAALVIWFRARHERGGGVVDLLVILILPVMGPAAYLLGHHLADRRRPRQATASSDGSPGRSDLALTE